MSANHEDLHIDKIIRSKRKTVSLEVKRDGSLVVRVPVFMTRGQVEELVNSKESWIRKKRKQVKVRLLESPTKQYTPGEEFWYLGNTYHLELIKEQETPLSLGDKFYLVEKFQPEGRRIFEKWYKERGAIILKERVKNQAEVNGFSYTNVRVTSAKTRWGSCGAKGSLNFTWRLVMAPIEVIDYVIVHELVHLDIKNHSKSFWKEVGKLLPGYQQQQRWLKENGHRLTLD